MSQVVVIAAGLAILALLLYGVTLYNGFIQLRNNIEKSWANIDVLLKQRHDEVPNLVACVQGVAAFEQKVMENVTLARTQGLEARTIGEKAKASAALSSAVGSLFAVAEKYPDLKASESYLALQKRLTGLENEIADRREFYNDSVNNFNVRIQQFPDVFLARPLGFKPREMFKVNDEDKRVIQIQFGAK